MGVFVEAVFVLKELGLMIWQRSLEIFNVIITNRPMLFTLLPLLVTLLVVELYFGKYRREELGWNTAVGNSIVLFFVGMNLFGYLSSEGVLFVASREAIVKSLIACFVVFESVILLLTNFYHLIPKQISFDVSSTAAINFIGVIGIILVYSSISLDMVTIAAFLVMFVVLIIVIKFLQSLEAPDFKGQKGSSASSLAQV